jgi:hypothetical protein
MCGSHSDGYEEFSYRIQCSAAPLKVYLSFVSAFRLHLQCKSRTVIKKEEIMHEQIPLAVYLTRPGNCHKAQNYGLPDLIHRPEF